MVQDEANKKHRRSKRVEALEKYRVPKQLQDLRDRLGEAGVDALTSLHYLSAIDYDSIQNSRDTNPFPDDYGGIGKCHLRAAFQISHAAAEYLYEKKISHKKTDIVKQTLQDHLASETAQLFRLRKEMPGRWHWVAIDEVFYYDENKVFEVWDYTLACAILECMELSESEFGNGSTFVRPEDVVTFCGNKTFNH